MTGSLDPARRYTVEEYLELEARLPDAKLEYREGVVVDVRELIALDSGGINHSLIAANLCGVFGSQLKGSMCNAYAGDLRCRTPKKTLFAYPALTVICGKPESESHPTAGDTVTNPSVVVEMFSPSMEQYARGRKFALHQQIPSLTDYVLVSRSDLQIDAYSRQAHGAWSIAEYAGRAAIARIASLNIDLPLSEVYYAVDFRS